VNFSDSAVIILCLVGAGIILLSQSIAISIRKTVSPSMRRSWLAIIFLMGFFIAGYLLFTYSLYKQVSIPQEIIIGLVFFGGACFVYLVVKISQQSLQALVEANKDLEHETTVRLQTEEELHRAQKYEAIGTLTGGIAHEFNNILTSIIGYAELLGDALPREEEAKKYSDMVISSATRAAKLTESLLTFSRKQITRAEILDMNELLAETGVLLSSVVENQTLLKITLAQEPLLVQADRSQIQQVIVNLTSNAIDAMPDGGTLQIASEHISLKGQTAFKDMVVPAGEYALLRVEDTGVGMTEEVSRKIFEPFFTTKGLGGGPGLGLSVVYGIVKRHEGFISVTSNLGLGTKVLIFLPQAAAKKQK
jgi:signal transduction histidine kinase